MLSSAYDAGPRVRSLPMSTSQPPGSMAPLAGPGVIAAPSTTTVINVPLPPQPSSVPLVSAPGSMPLSSSLPKNGIVQGVEEEVRFTVKSSLL